MSLFGPTLRLDPSDHHDARELVQPHRPMRRLLAFAGRSIDDVVNCPVARQQVIYYFRVGKFIDRRAEVVELERQWNPLGRRL